ncbi:MAG: LptF/LptG family permease [Acidobacteriota bacterium]
MVDDHPDSANTSAGRGRTVLARIFSASTMGRIVDPVIADYQKEYADAEAGRHPWVRLVLILRWTHALARALLTDGLSRLEPFDADAWRPLARGAVAGGAILLAITWPQSLRLAWSAVGRGARPELAALMPLQGLPPILAVAIPCAVLLGAITATAAFRPGVPQRDHARGGPLFVASLLGAVLTLTLVAWAVPKANQAFRTTVLQIAAERYAGQLRSGAPADGPRELTLAELGREVARYSPRQFPAVRQYELEWHRRLAIAGASLVFGLIGLALGSGRFARRLAGRLALATLVIAGYYALLFWGDLLVRRLILPAAAGAWLANGVVSGLALSLLMAQHIRRRPSTHEAPQS